MRKLVFDDLSEPIQNFLRQLSDEGVLVEDRSGQARYGIVSYPQVSAEERARSLAALRSLQKTLGDRMRADGRTPEQLDQILAAEEPVHDRGV